MDGCELTGRGTDMHTHASWDLMSVRWPCSLLAQASGPQQEAAGTPSWEAGPGCCTAVSPLPWAGWDLGMWAAPEDRQNRAPQVGAAQTSQLGHEEQGGGCSVLECLM